MPADPPPTPHELLAFYMEAGVDCALDDVPCNRLAEPEPPRPAAAALRPAEPAPAATPALPGHAAPPDTVIQSARDAARNAATLTELRALMEAFDGCALKATASRLVFADGNPQARVMFVGEAPGRDEDLQGLPFVGRSGKLLDRMLAAIGLDRGSAYIANIIPWRPPGNRDPSPIETQICLPFIKRHIELVDPDVLVCLGKPSTQTLLNTTDGIVRTRGRWFDYDTGSRVIAAIPTFHPAYLLRQPVSKRQSWQDFRAIARRLAERAGARPQ